MGWYIANPGTKTLTLWIHHIVSITLMADPLFAGDSGAETCHMIFMAEITIPPLMIRWFLRDAGYPTVYILVFEYMFLIPYFYFRVIVGSQFMYDLTMNDKSRATYKINCWMMYFAGLMYLKDRALSSLRRTRKFFKTT